MDSQTAHEYIMAKEWETIVRNSEEHDCWVVNYRNPRNGQVQSKKICWNKGFHFYDGEISNPGKDTLVILVRVFLLRIRGYEYEFSNARHF